MKRTSVKERSPGEMSGQHLRSWWEEPAPLVTANASLRLFTRLLDFRRTRPMKNPVSMSGSHSGLDR